MINPSKYRVSQSWRIRLHALPALVVFFYRNLPSISQDGILKLMDVLLECLSDEKCGGEGDGIEGVLGRGQVLPAAEHHTAQGNPVSVFRTASAFTHFDWVQNRFVALARRRRCRRGATRATRRRSARCTLRFWAFCALLESLPYSVEPWIPPLTEGKPRPVVRVFRSDVKLIVLAPHATDPPPISTTIRKCALEFKKVCI